MKKNSAYAVLCMLCIVVAAIPISGAVGDQNSNDNQADLDSDLQIGISGNDVQEAQSVINNKKPFGENSSKILGTNNSDGKLRIGSTGDEVKKLQQWLTDYDYYGGDIDGVFGEDTETAVKNFQEEAGLIVDGVVGNDTNKAMANWDKIVAEVQAAGENDYASETNTATQNTRKQYTTAVRNYGTTYGNTRSYRGDCWDVSAAVYSQLTSSGQRARIIQYSNSYSSRHRSVQTWNGNKWVDYENVPWVGSPTARGSSETVITGN